MSSEFSTLSVGVIINEIHREIGMRRRVYPELVNRKRLNQKTADYRIMCLTEAIRYLEEMQVINSPSYGPPVQT